MTAHDSPEAIHPLVQRAKDFACVAHIDDKRRYTSEPYENHLFEVVAILKNYDYNETALATAYLHDVVEDCGISLDVIEKHFGKTVCDGVYYLSDVNQTGNRKARKLQTQERLKDAPGWVQSIKCADIISNAVSIRKHDQKFAPLFIQECTDLLDLMYRAHPPLRTRAYEACGTVPKELRHLPAWNDHDTATLINKLIDCAQAYGHTQQLRGRISAIITPVCEKAKEGKP